MPRRLAVERAVIGREQILREDAGWFTDQPTRLAYEVCAITGKNPLLDIALKLEEVALSDSYFVDRRLYPNVDFYSGLIYQAMGFPMDMFTVLFSIPRTAGWLAHYIELLDQDSRIARPRQCYTGHPVRDYVPISER